MQRHDAERLIVSIVIAAVLFAAAGGVLALVGIPEAELPEYNGPVFITIAEDPLLLSEPEIETVPEETAPEPVRAEPESVPESSPAETRSSRDRETPRPVPRERNADTRSDTQPVPDETFEEPRPDAADEPQPDTTRPAEREPAPGPEESAEAPEQAEEYETAGVDTGTAETEPLPAGNSETTAGPETPEEPEDSEPEQPEEAGILGDQVLSQLDDALADADSRGTRNGTADGSITAGNPGDGASDSVTTLGTADNPIDLDTLEGRRKLLYKPQPEIPSELSRNLPPKFDVVISFTLEPSGSITDLNITTDSGNTKVDSIIQNTIRKWRFEPVSPEAGTIQVRVRYNIRVR